eukprot:20803-Heterococcus_DN1.PRE.3
MLTTAVGCHSHCAAVGQQAAAPGVAVCQRSRWPQGRAVTGTAVTAVPPATALTGGCTVAAVEMLCAMLWQHVRPSVPRLECVSYAAIQRTLTLQLAMGTHYRSRVDELQEDNHILRDACLRLESEVAKLRNVVAVTAVTAVTAGGSQQAGSNNGALTVPPRVSHMVIPEHGHVAWEVRKQRLEPSNLKRLL